MEFKSKHKLDAMRGYTKSFESNFHRLKIGFNNKGLISVNWSDDIGKNIAALKQTILITSSPTGRWAFMLYLRTTL